MLPAIYRQAAIVVGHDSLTMIDIVLHRKTQTLSLKIMMKILR